MMIVRHAALVIALAACSKVLGFKEVTVADGGIDPGVDGSTDAGTLAAPPNTVVGRAYTRCRQMSGDIDSPTDLSQSIIQALIFDDSKNSYRTVDGAGKADGTFRIDDVPDGATYLFRLGTLYYVTDQHVLDYSFEAARRCAPTPDLATTGTRLDLEVKNMTPYHVTPDGGDVVDIVSFALPYHSGLANPANAGATVLDYPLIWGDGSFVSGPLAVVDASAGDDLFVFHSRRDVIVDPSNQRRTPVYHLTDWFQPTGVTMQSGAATPVTGFFQAAPLNKMISFTINRGLFDAGHDGTTVFSTLDVSIMATPLLDDIQAGQTLVSFQLGDISRSTDLRQSIIDYRYADPFPDSWKRYSIISYLRESWADPFDTPTGRSVAFTRQVAEYTTTINASPVLQPPSGARIGGVDFALGGNVAFDGVSPVEVTWNAVLSAKSYRLAITRVAASGRQSVASIRTTSTSLKVPAELFRGGQFFTFLLSATRGPNDYQAGHIVPSGLPSQVADTPSGMFRFSSDCGDGVVKPGEESCDTRGESATCDVDCTRPRCGDGLRNAAAGEACDSAGLNTVACDADCTVPVCGDGYTNYALEDCDDGNTVDDGNGCATNCKFNNRCGDGRVDRPMEECDPGQAGQTATCDADCTRPRCGDELVNAAAGEQCDDGLANGTGRCTATCTLGP